VSLAVLKMPPAARWISRNTSRLPQMAPTNLVISIVSMRPSVSGASGRHAWSQGF
jgi:hypothetical protein